MPQNPYIPGAGYDNRRGGAYQGGGQVNPYTPAVGPYGSSNPGQNQKELEIANRYGPHTGIPHPMTTRDGVSSNPAYGGQTVVNPQTGYQTGKVTDPTSPHFGAEYNTATHIYNPDTKLVVAIPRNEEGNVQPRPGDGNTERLRNARLEDGFTKADTEQSGLSAEDAIRNSVGSKGEFTGSMNSPEQIRSYNEATRPSGTSPSSFRQETTARYPKMSASLNRPISEFGIEDGTEHLQKLYDKQRELMDVHGLSSQDNAGIRAIRQRAVQLDDHITKLKKSAALKTPEQLAADGERPLPPRKPDQYVGPLETDWEQGMHGFDKDGSGGLNQEELRAWRKWKQVGQGKRPDHRGNIVGEGHPNFTKHGSSTQMTPPGMMPGYTIGGGVDTTGTQHQDTGGVNPDAPLFGAGMGFGTPPLGAPDDPSVSGQDMMQQFPPGMPNPTPDARLETNYGVAPSSGMMPPVNPAEQAGMTDSVTATQQQGISNIVKLIETGKRSYQEVMSDPNLPSNIKSQIAQLDSDGDGKLSKREMKSADYIHQRMENATRPGSGEDRNGLLARIRANRQQRRGN